MSHQTREYKPVTFKQNDDGEWTVEREYKAFTFQQDDHGDWRAVESAEQQMSTVSQETAAACVKRLGREGWDLVQYSGGQREGTDPTRRTLTFKRQVGSEPRRHDRAP